MPRLLWRLVRLTEHLLTGAAMGLMLQLLLWLGVRPPLARLTRWWHARLCRALGVRVVLHGQPAPGALLVANHISWLDIPLLGAQADVVFLSKAEVRRWPLIGWFARLAGTLFIERGAHQSARATASIGAALASGRGVVVFPEGTTTNGQTVGHFHARLFAAVQNAPLLLQPLAIRYRHGNQPQVETRAAYIDNDSLLQSLLRIASHPDLVAEIHCAPPLRPSAGLSRRALAEHSRAAILEALGLPVEPARAERPSTTPLAEAA